MRFLGLFVLVVAIGCGSEDKPTSTAPASSDPWSGGAAPAQSTRTPPPKRDPKRDCESAASELITRLRRCDLNMDGITPSTLCANGAFRADAIRAMTADSCDEIMRQLGASM